MTQEIIVAIVLTACVAFTARRLWQRFHTPTACDCDSDDTSTRNIYCAGCPLADKCNTCKS